ncbi:ABC transporter substrate-binding protein [Pseudazoarcus pumilus]|uniref:ABC transporter substrate-binding protein n=1 Tax=Pseudazoarcus pumilus TaxID=2067960 RepID=A0A2I6S2Z6_9RHOO|nr:ABC transporter substrate-binding protein [Pseudazoarcus pumilus]AUN93587.1 ABC transporter substrate-binding protein [Pseudazoarcus pumilus]
MTSRTVRGLLAAALVSGGTLSLSAHSSEPCIGASLPITGPTAWAAESIRMGAEVAIAEINAAGGVLGKPLSFVTYDDGGQPPRGVDNARRIAEADNCIAMFGGWHSGVALAVVEPVHEAMMPYIAVISAGTKITENGRDPNYMFRVSMFDRWQALALIRKSKEVTKSGVVGVMYEDTGWGQGAVPDLKASAEAEGATVGGMESFKWEDRDMTAQLMRLRDAKVDTIILYSRDLEANQILRSMQRIGYKPTIVSAWGNTGTLGELAGDLADGMIVLQTYSWMGDLAEQPKAVLDTIMKNYKLKSPDEIRHGSGAANTYDAVYILAEAIKKAGEYDRSKVREALYDVHHQGIVQNYSPAFEPGRHNAILPENYVWTAWHEGRILPIEQTPYAN